MATRVMRKHCLLSIITLKTVYHNQQFIACIRIKWGICGPEHKEVYADLTLGISRISKSGITSYSKRHGLLSDIVNGVLIDQEGSVWFNQDDGISQFRESGFELYNEKDGLVYNEVYAILKNRDDFWIGTAKGISIFRPAAKSEKTFKTMSEMDRLPSNLQIPPWVPAHKYPNLSWYKL